MFTRLEASMTSLPKNRCLRQWLGRKENWQWSLSYDDGFRYGQMVTNLVVAVNSVLRRIRHLPISAIFSATLYRLDTLMPMMELRQVKQIKIGHVYVEAVRKAMTVNTMSTWGMNAELCYECGRFQTLRYSCAHVHAACAHANLDVEQFIDEVYMLQYRSFHRHPKGPPHLTRIQNDMDVRETSEPKQCTVCRTSGHNRSTCPHRVYVPSQSSCNLRLEDDD
ncbi:hypothetical protein GOBAR_DD36824 [Gossypium barbadense]|nr:hypothetical protein GOBAR_DD36824 [Gossypium barbadense]